MILKATVVTNSSGDATVYVSHPQGAGGVSSSTSPLPPMRGPLSLESITYTKTDYAAGVDFAITEYESGVVLWTGTNVDSSITIYPRAFVSDAATGTASTSVYDLIRIINGHIKIVVSSGGNTKTGAFYFKLSD